MKRRAGASRGFTLLEVLVAISILGLGLTVILSSQVGLFSSAQRAQNISVATGLARCKMAEAELELTQQGYPLVDQNDEGRCCDDEDVKGFRCKWKIETVKLPEPKGLSDIGGDGGLDDQSGLGTLGALQSVQSNGAAALTGDGGISGLSGLLSSAAGGGTQGMAPLVMGMVYPDLKPMLEASIRKVSVSVLWKEGSRERDFSITMYVTNPQQGGLDPNAAKGLDELGEKLQP
ncbi:MAG: type II secretion system protein [Polyangiaceae bacterium]